MISIVKQIINQTNLSEQEAWWMLQSITNKTKEKLLLMSEQDISQKEKQTINAWITKLAQEHIPLTYLIGHIPFLDLNLTIEPPILIPRPETEEWVAQAIKDLKPHHTKISNILDIGTGSGCIALAFAQHFPNAHITAVDINPQAIKLAQKNAKQNNITNITFIKSDLFSNLDNQCFDVIVSNPPYIDPQDIQTMMPQVTDWEDKKALFANKQGSEVLEKIIQHAITKLSPNDLLPYQLILEFGYNQKDIIENLAQQNNWNCFIKKDNFGQFRTARLTINHQP